MELTSIEHGQEAKAYLLSAKGWAPALLFLEPSAGFGPATIYVAKVKVSTKLKTKDGEPWVNSLPQKMRRVAFLIGLFHWFLCLG